MDPLKKLLRWKHTICEHAFKTFYVSLGFHIVARLKAMTLIIDMLTAIKFSL